MEVAVEMARVGGRLREARERAQLTQGDVVEALRQAAPELAVKRPTIGNWEAGRNLPCVLQFRELSTIYGVMGYRIMYGNAPVDFNREEAAEVRALAAGASPAVQRKLNLVLALARATDPAEA